MKNKGHHNRRHHDAIKFRHTCDHIKDPSNAQQLPRKKGQGPDGHHGRCHAAKSMGIAMIQIVAHGKKIISFRHAPHGRADHISKDEGPQPAAANPPPARYTMPVASPVTPTVEPAPMLAAMSVVKSSFQEKLRPPTKKSDAPVDVAFPIP